MNIEYMTCFFFLKNKQKLFKSKFITMFDFSE